MNPKNILVTGAAGYIGSVVAEKLANEGYNVIALDNMKKGHRQAVDKRARLFIGDIGDSSLLSRVFSEIDVYAVIHLAAHSIVSESMVHPDDYFRNNVIDSLNLLNAMVQNKVNKMIFSSSAAVYGIPATDRLDENNDPNPVNPYGESKLIFEKTLRWYGQAFGIESISLRYFNAAGATAEHGEHHEPETHLIPNVIRAAMKKEAHVTLFGTDYDTRDGTCIRDYIHVSDIADAHIKALDRIEDAGVRAYNLGNETGFSNYDVIKMVEKFAGLKIPVVLGPRRAGDPPVLIAQSQLARKDLGWNPTSSNLETIVTSAWQWHIKNPDGYAE
jgi:UDP-glucose 4-epimerase